MIRTLIDDGIRHAEEGLAQIADPIPETTVPLEDLADDAVDAILDAAQNRTSPFTMIQLRVLGGAMSRVASDATAFAHRDAPVMFISIARRSRTPSSEPVHRAWTESLFEALEPHDAGVYSNFLEAEGEDRVRAAYPGGTYERLADIKRRYDPSNLFDQNQNIRPALAMG